jgi:cell division septal protein FtsQ
MGLFRKKERPFNHRKSRPRESSLQVSARAPSGRGRDRMHKIGALILLAVALAGAVWAAKSGLAHAGDRLFSRNGKFTIRVIELTTTGTLPVSNLREYAGVAEGQNLFAVDIGQIARNIERTPRVRSAEVRRVLPDKLTIRVQERAALARIAEGATGLPMAVDRDGFVLGPSVGRGLPIISGIAESGLAPGSVIRDPRALDALQALDVCEQTKLGALLRIQAINVKHPDYLDLALASGARVEIGRDRIAWRLEKLADLIATHRELGMELEYADLTVDRNFPVRTRPAAEARAR